MIVYFFDLFFQKIVMLHRQFGKYRFFIANSFVEFDKFLKIEAA